jgi:hypothetical protein
VIALMMLLAQPVPAPEPLAQSESAIVVVGQRLERLRFRRA